MPAPASVDQKADKNSGAGLSLPFSLRYDGFLTAAPVIPLDNLVSEWRLTEF